jgi:hypothetical protein
MRSLSPTTTTFPNSGIRYHKRGTNAQMDSSEYVECYRTNRNGCYQNHAGISSTVVAILFSALLLLATGCSTNAITRESATHVIPSDRTLDPVGLQPGMTAWFDELNAGISFDDLAGDSTGPNALVHLTIGWSEKSSTLLLEAPDISTRRTVCHPLPAALSPWLVCLSKVTNEAGIDEITFFVSQYRQ